MAKAKGRNGQTITEPSNANLDFHAALGGTTAALYFTTAYFAIAAPKIPGHPKHGAIRFHEALAFVHGPGMISRRSSATMRTSRRMPAKRSTASPRPTAPSLSPRSCAYGASIVAVSWPIHLKFWEKQ